MPLSVNNIISNLDTPSSLLPFFVKDAFDVTGRTVMAQNEGGKHEAREKFIEEAGTSLFWIGGIPAIRAISNKIFKNKLDTDIHFKRINAHGPQSYFAKSLEGVELGGEKLAQIQKKLAGEGLKKYKNYHIGTTAASVLINLFMLTVALPQFNQFLSRKIISKEVQEKQNEINYDDFEFGAKKSQNIKSKKQSFGSLSSLKDFFNVKDLLNFSKMAENAQLNVQTSMLLLDYGISGSRVTFIPRDNNERVEYAIKEGGIIFFFYFAADLIKKGLANVADKVFKTPIALDYKVLNNPEFLAKLKNVEQKDEVLSFTTIKNKNAKNITKTLAEEIDNFNELSVIKMIDKELASTNLNTKEEDVFKNFTLRMAQKEGLIKVEPDKELGKWIRHSKKYIETDKVIALHDNLGNFFGKTLEQIKNKPSINIEKIIAKTKGAKIASIFANMAICCASLAFILPKIQYTIREHRTKTNQAPGIKFYQELAENNKLEI